MECNNYNDNRDSGVNVIPSGNVPYTGYISNSIIEDISCKPSVNDILKKIQELIDGIKAATGDNKTLTTNCLTFNAATATQKEINQEIIDVLCSIKSDVDGLKNEQIDPSLIKIAIDLLCLEQAGCTPQLEYSLTYILTKLVGAYCNLLGRVQNIETILNI